MKRLTILTTLLLTFSIVSAQPTFAQEPASSLRKGICKQDSAFVQLGQNTQKWEKGLKLAVAGVTEFQRDYKLEMIAYDSIPDFNSYTGDLQNGITASSFKDKTLTVVGFESDPIPERKYGIRSFTVSYIVVSDGEYKYKIIVSTSTENKPVSLFSRGIYCIDAFKSLQSELVGKVLYTKTFLWECQHNGHISNMYENTMKFHPVKISRVLRNSDMIVICFIPEGDTKEYVFTCQERREPLSMFYGLLTFCSPKSNFSKMSSKQWGELKKGNITRGVKMADVQALLGEPDVKTSRNTKYGNMTMWTYYYIAKRAYQITFKEGKVEDSIMENSQ